MTNEERAKKLADDIIYSAFENIGNQKVESIVDLILAYSDEIRRECADRIEAWWLNEETELSETADENVALLRSAIMGEEAGE